MKKEKPARRERLRRKYRYVDRGFVLLLLTVFRSPVSRSLGEDA